MIILICHILFSSSSLITNFTKNILNYSKPISGVERYDIMADQWTVLEAQMNLPREGNYTIIRSSI